MGPRTPSHQPKENGQQCLVGDINGLIVKRQAMEYKQSFCCSRIKSKVNCPTGQ